MAQVPAGSFWMGCNAAVDSDCYDEEKPYHEVYLSEYEIDETEVTVAAYGACVTAKECTEPIVASGCNWNVTGRESHPVNCVDWFQATAYCAWAGKRLPTEAEWEKAARGTDGRKYPWGNEAATCERAVMNEGDVGCGEADTWPVKSKPLGASPYGAHDMVGNVWEWVADWYDNEYYASSPTSDPQGPASGSDRVGRGGGFGDIASVERASIRAHRPPSLVIHDLGFRCSRSLD
jgi:formylglycine-generating enzyme required for sulfatase activity